MSRKLALFILIPAVLFIGGFLFLQYSLRKSIDKEAVKEGNTGEKQTLVATDSLGGKKVSEADLRPLFIEKMQQLLKKSSNGLYNLSVGDLKVDVLASKISLHNVSVRPDDEGERLLKAKGQLPPDVFDVSFNSLVIEGVNLDDAITSKTMDYKLIRLVNPVVKISRHGGKKPKSNEDFSQRFLKEMQKLSIKKLVVEGGDVVVTDKQKGSIQKLGNVQVLMNDILLDSTTRTDKDRFLFAKEAQIDFQNFNTRSKDGLYNFKIGNVSVNAPQKKLTLKNLSYAATVSKEDFQKKNKVAKEMYGISLPSLTITGVDWWQALNADEITANTVEMNGGKISVYLDRNMPPTNKMGNFPSQMLMKAPLKINIDRLKINSVDLSYEEYNPLSKQSGTLYFDNASIAIRNISNEKGNNKSMSVDASALFMHRIPMTANFRFDMSRYKTGHFTAALHIEKDVDGDLLNSFAMPLGMMKIEKGAVQKLDMKMAGDQLGANGNLLLLYNDLKIAMLEKEKDRAALDKKNATSLFANLFVLKNDNPKGNNEPRKAEAQFKRDPMGGFMQLVWKTTLVGILKTIGAPEKAASKKR